MAENKPNNPSEFSLAKVKKEGEQDKLDIADLLDRVPIESISLFSESGVLPFEEIYIPFQDAFLEFVEMDADAFEVLTAFSPAPAAGDDPGFLGLDLEELLNVELDDSGTDAVSLAQTENEGSVESISRGLAAEDFDGSNRFRRIESVERDLFTDTKITQVQQETSLPTIIIENGLPTAINLIAGPSIGFYQFENALRTQSSVTLTGNIFEEGANPGPDGLAALDLNSSRVGSVKSFILGGIQITTPEGNTMVLYTSALPLAGIEVGDYVYTLNNPILHLPNDITDINEDFNNNLVYINTSLGQVYIDKFTYTIVDGNGDSATAFLNAQVVDDEPTTTNQSAPDIDEANIFPDGSNLPIAQASVSGSLINVPDNVFGSDGGVVSNVTIPGGTTVITLTTITVTTSIGQLVVDRATGNYTYTLSNNIDNDSSSNPLDQTSINATSGLQVFSYEFTDADQDKYTATLTVEVIDDEPIATDISVHTLNEADIVSVGSDADAAAPTATGSLLNGAGNVFGADGGSVSNVTIAGGSTVVTATTITVTTAEGNTLVVTRATGAYTYTLLFPIDNDSDANASTTQGTDVFNFSFTDNDGDSKNANLTITIVDDEPIATDISGGSLNEADIVSVGSDADAAAPTATGSLLNGAGNVFGADGGSVSNVTIAGGSTVVTATTITVTTAEGNTLVVTRATGAYTYTLLFPIDNDSDANASTTQGTDVFNFSFTDNDGDSKNANLTITIVDDEPIATDNINSVNESLLLEGGAVATGNLFTEDTGDGVDVFGADGAKIFAINGIQDNASGDSDSNLGSISTQTLYDTGSGSVEGKLTVNTTTGAYSFELVDASSVPDSKLTTQHVSTYTIIDGDGDTSTKNLTINIDLNQVPVVNDVSANGNEDDLSIAVTLTGSDSDVGGTIASFNVPSLPSNGTLYADAALTIAVVAGTYYAATSNQLTLYFVPNAHFNGSISFDYGAKDNTGDVSLTTETATISIASVNDAPEGADNTVSTDEDTAYVFTIADFGFSDPNDVPANALLAVTITTLPQAGLLTNDGNAVSALDSILLADINAGKLVFTPAANANGVGYAGFSFQVQDDGTTANGGVDLDQTPNTINIDVNPVNDNPTVTDVIEGGNEDAAAIPVSLIGSDIDGTIASFSLSTLPSNGSLYTDNSLSTLVAINTDYAASGNQLILYFVPDLNFNGSVSFDYGAKDNLGLATLVDETLTINIASVNDAPEGADNTVSTDEDIPYVFTTADFGYSDPNDVPANALLAVTITSLPLAGVLTNDGNAVSALDSISLADINAGKLVFTPAANANGVGYAGFSFQVQDDGNTANGGVDLDQSANTITIDVDAVNDAPTGSDVVITTNEDTAFVFSAANFGFSDANDSPANSLLAVRITTLPGAGTLSNNSVPVIAGSLIPIADINAGLLIFTPAANANGSGYASFTYQVQDDGGTSNAGVDLDQTPNTINIDVSAVNDPPIVNDVIGSGNEDAVSIAVTLTGSDVDGTIASFNVSSLPSNGTLYADAGLSIPVVIAADYTATSNQLTLYFVPNLNFNGSVSFDYGAKDNLGADTLLDETATINVAAVNDAPVVVDVLGSGNEDAASIAVTLTGSDVDGTIASFNVSSLPSNGTLYADAALSIPVVIATDYTATSNQLTLYFVPNLNFNGSVSFDYGAKDNLGADTLLDETATINVAAVNDAPVINNLNGDILAYTESNGALVLDQSTAASVTDIDSVDFNGGVFTAEITTNALLSEDLLGVQNQGFGAGQIGVSGSDISYENVVIGSISGLSTNTKLIINLDPDATPASVSALLKAITYTNTNTSDPNNNTRTVSFTVSDGDGGTSNIANVNVTVADLPDLFTGSADTVNFNSLTLSQSTAITNGANLYNALGGNDIVTLPTDSTVAATIGYSAANTFFGGDGDDQITGGSLADRIEGGAGNDKMIGGTGNDVYIFDADSALGTDTITETAGSGTDTLDFSGTSLGISLNLSAVASATQLVNANLSLIFTDANTIENVTSGSGNDTLTGNSSNNVLIGGSGDDTYVFDADVSSGKDTITEVAVGGGVDTIDFSATTSKSINIDLSSTASQNIASGKLDITLTNVAIENVIGGSAADTIIGNSSNNKITGGGGSDNLTGNGGTDTFIYNNISDRGATNDTITDFAAGVGGDILNLTNLFANSVTGFTGNVTGFLQFVQSGANTLVQVDVNGGGDSYVTLASLTSVTAASMIAANWTVIVVPPLVLDLNGDGIHLISSTDSNVAWDFYHNDEAIKMGWVSAEDGILVYDYNGDRIVTDINEFMLTAHAPGANTDLEAMRIAFDSNHDGVFDTNDEKFSDFGVWQDKDSDGVVGQNEYFTLSEMDIKQIKLSGELDLSLHSLVENNPNEVAAGNLINSYISYETTDGNIHLAADVGLSIYTGQPDVVLMIDSIEDAANPVNELNVILSHVSQSVSEGALIINNDDYPLAEMDIILDTTVISGLESLSSEEAKLTNNSSQTPNTSATDVAAGMAATDAEHMMHDIQPPDNSGSLT